MPGLIIWKNQEFDKLRKEMDRMFDRLMTGRSPASWMRPGRWELPFRLNMPTELPNVDLIDRGNEFLLRAEIPGVEKGDLDVSLTDSTVILRGKVTREEEKKEDNYYFCETGHGEFTRTIALPAEVDGSKAKATYKNGVIELLLPKSEAAKPRKIKID